MSRKLGWRRPPIGAEILFEDFDRQKRAAFAALPRRPMITSFSSVSVPPLPNLLGISLKTELLSIEEELEQEIVGGGMMMAGMAPGGAAGSDIPDDPTAQIKIEELQLSVVACKALKRAQVNSVADLLDYTEEDIRQIKYFSQKSFEEVVEALQRRGISLPSTKSVSPAPTRGLFAQTSAKAMPTRGGTTEFLHQGRSRSSSRNENSTGDLLAYSLMQLGTPDDLVKRGRLAIAPQYEVYLESLRCQQVFLNFKVLEVVQQAVANAKNCFSVKLPLGGINVRNVAGSFDYAYSAEGRVDLPSDGQFHSVALTSKSTDVDLRYVVVPREDTNVFRIAQLRNPLQASLLAGSTDVYVDCEYILSTNIATVPPQGQMELGLGVEQAIKVARNTSYHEVRSGETIVSFNELRHNIKIDITNLMPRAAKIEVRVDAFAKRLRQEKRLVVRHRLPIPDESAKVDVQIEQVTPTWEKYEQTERETPIRGGYRWLVEVPAREQTTLSVDYTIKTFVDSELIGGNRREA